MREGFDAFGIGLWNRWFHRWHLVKRVKPEGIWVRGVDLKHNEYAEIEADDFVIGDLRDPYFCRHVIDRRFDEVYQLAADMGGAGFVFTGENDADIMQPLSEGVAITYAWIERQTRSNAKGKSLGTIPTAMRQGGGVAAVPMPAIQSV